MIFIHHHNDSEREEKPPPNIRRIAYRIREKGGPVLKADMRGFVSAKNAIIENVRSTPNDCGSDCWEFVIEDTDL